MESLDTKVGDKIKLEILFLLTFCPRQVKLNLFRINSWFDPLLLTHSVLIRTIFGSWAVQG